MAFKKTLAHRLLNITKVSYQTLTTCRISSSRMPQKKQNIDPGDSRMLQRFLYKGAGLSPENVGIATGESLINKIRQLGVSKERIPLEMMLPSKKVSPSEEMPEESPTVRVSDAKKLIRAAEMQMVRSRLKEIGKTWISYSDFVRVCGEACSDPERGIRVATMLDGSGNVVVLGRSVCLRPELITKALEGLFPKSVTARDDVQKAEFKKLEAVKSEIDKRADAAARRELWAGLGFLAVQTVGFMRLTFWELSWDVMEPICFFFTSTYFMAGYAFFLRTSKEPTFEGFYHSRFEAKQKRLMAVRNFDIHRYMELRQIFSPNRPALR